MQSQPGLHRKTLKNDGVGRLAENKPSLSIAHVSASYKGNEGLFFWDLPWDASHLAGQCQQWDGQGRKPRLYAVSSKALGTVATHPCVLFTKAKLHDNKGLS